MYLSNDQAIAMESRLLFGGVMGVGVDCYNRRIAEDILEQVMTEQLLVLIVVVAIQVCSCKEVHKSIYCFSHQKKKDI